jgi:hypothetical protein
MWPGEGTADAGAEASADAAELSDAPNDGLPPIVELAASAWLAGAA